jgi:hypothetical protein
MRLNRHHVRLLLLVHTRISLVLVDIGDDACSAPVLGQNSILRNFSLCTPQNRRFLRPRHSLVKELTRTCVQATITRRTLQS